MARVEAGGVVIARSNRTLRVLETSHPPVHYFPPDDLELQLLTPVSLRTWCEFKGSAHYYNLESVSAVAWTYPEPTPGYEPIRDYLAFYPGRVDACYLDDEPVRAQEGDFYGGWITSGIEGPFKGAPGTSGW
jgi:uncharacterized protein (DUF427 family)